MYFSLYVSDTKRNSLIIKLMKTFTESHRVSDSFQNITVKIRFIHCQYIKQIIDISKYGVAEITNT